MSAPSLDLIREFNEWRARHPKLSGLSLDEWWAQRVELGLHLHGASVYAQRHVRIRDDSTALNTDGGWLAAEDTQATVDMEKPFRVRIAVEETSGNGNNNSFILQYRKNGGTWTDCGAETEWPTPGGVTTSTPISVSTQFADADACSTELLSASGNFNTTGEAVEGANSTNNNNFGSATTEWEWAVLIHRYHDSEGKNADADRFEFRMVQSDGTVFGTYDAFGDVLANLPAGLLGGTYAEAPSRIGPFIDSNGNLYTIIEDAEDTANVLMMKSTDGGTTWDDVDTANNPAVGDMEAVDVVQDGDTLHILSQPDEVVYHTFRTSDHPTNADTWGVTDESVKGVTGVIDQSCGLEVRSDGTVVAFYSATDTTIGYKIRNGTWGSENTITDGTNTLSGLMLVKGASDLIHLFYSSGDGVNYSVLHRTFNSSDVLSSPDTVDSGLPDGTAERIPISVPVYYDDGGVEVVMVGIMQADQGDLDTYAYRDNVKQSVQAAANDNGIAANQLASRLPQATLVADGTTVYLHYVSDPNFNLYRDSNADEAGWGTDTLELSASPHGTDIQFQRANVVTHSAGNGGAKVIAQVYDAGPSTGGSGHVWYREFELPSAGVSQTIGQAVETDTAQAVGSAKDATIGQALEADTAQPVSAETATVVEVGQAVESDTAQPVSAAKVQVIGQAVESDTAQSVAAAKAAAIGQATETDTAQGVSSSQAQVVGQASETDTAQPVTAAKTQAIGQAAETDTAQAVTAIQAIQVGQAVETDTAQALTWAKQLTIGLASETDTAQTVSAGGALAVGQAAETDTAFAVAVVKAQTVGQALETGTAFALAAIKVQAIGRALETDTATSVGSLKLVVIGQASETDTAFAVASIQLVAIGQATESDTAQPVSVVKVDIIGQATETDMAFALTVFGVVLAIKALAYYRFYRINGHLVAGAIGRGGHRGYRTSEGYERVSDVVRIDESPENGADIESAMAALSSAWATHSGSSAATLKAAIHSALQDAGWRGQGGVDLA